MHGGRLALPRSRDSPAPPRPPVRCPVGLWRQLSSFPPPSPFFAPASLRVFLKSFFCSFPWGGGVFPPPPATCSARPAGVALNTCICKPTSSSFGLLCGTVYFSLPYTTTTHKHGLCSWRNGGRSLPQAAFHRSLPIGTVPCSLPTTLPPTSEARSKPSSLEVVRQHGNIPGRLLHRARKLAAVRVPESLSPTPRRPLQRKF